MRVCIQLTCKQMSFKRDPCVKQNDNNCTKLCVCVYTYTEERVFPMNSNYFIICHTYTRCMFTRHRVVTRRKR